VLKKKDILDFLQKRGLITKEQLKQVEEEIVKTGLPVIKVLEKLEIISENDIVAHYAEAIGVAYVNLHDYVIKPEIFKLIPEKTAKKYKAIPLFRIGNSLTVAMTDPKDLAAIDEIRKDTQISVIEPVMATETAIDQLIEQYYGTESDIDQLIKGINLEAQKDGAVAFEEDIEENIPAPIIQLANTIIFNAVKERASDIHFEPEKDFARVRYRIDGVLHEIKTIPNYLKNALVSRIKVLANMDIAEKRKPQDGRIRMTMENKNLDIRVSSFPTIYGENLVMRLLDKSAVMLGLGELGLQDRDLEIFNKLIQRPNGIILVTGPTGSGKTTTLYAALSTINSMELNIITVEDPVEYELPLIRQCQVNPKAGITFANGLRSILRQDPDVIMVGEIRDRETAEIAVQASLTGHLVFSTLHTNDASGAVTRLIDMGVEPFLIASSVIGVLAQRLVRLICPKCKEEFEPPEKLLEELKLTKKIKFYHGKGCQECNNTGYSKRIGIFELLVVDEEIRRLTVARASQDEIKKVAVSKGMTTLFDDGMKKVEAGLTTIDELLRATMA